MPIDPRFLACLFDPADLVEVRLIPQRRTLFRRADRLTELDHELQDANMAGQHVYIGVNPRRRQGGKRQDVAVARCLFADLDKMTTAAGLRRIADAGLPTPTCAVSSGHGLHAYWRLSQPIKDLQKWTKAQKHLISALGSDPVIHDPPRIMRLPTFTNHKLPVAECNVIDTDPQRRYELRQIVPAGDDPQQVADHWLQKALRRATPGNRNDTGLWLAGQLRDAGVHQGQAKQVLREYARHLGDDYTEDEAVATARSAFSRPPREPARAKGQDAPDPPVIPLEDQALPDITPDALPKWARDHATALSAAKEVPVTMATLLQLATMASCVQRAFTVQVESSYAEPLCIYAAPALESGERKTAIHGPVVGPLFAFQKLLRDQAETELRAAQVQRRLVEQQIKALEKRHLKADPDQRRDIKQQIVELTGKLPPVQGLPQVIVEDFTEAALSVALASSGESLLVTSDEGGLFDNLSGRHSEISEIDLFLKAHTGSAHTVNRVGRDNLFLERPLLSVGISPQPAVLARLAGKEGFLTRGLTARFSWALPQSRVGRRKLNPAAIRVGISQAYRDGVIAMADLGQRHDGDPIVLRLSHDAYAIWKAFEREIEPRIGPDGDLQQIKPWASKLPGAVARVAAVCHVSQHLEHAASKPISGDQMQGAVEMGRLLIPHSVAAHRLMGGGGFTTAQAVVQHYNAAGWPQQVQSLTAWWRPVRRIVGDTSRDFEPVTQVLVDHGYLIPVPVTGAGRWGQHYRANQNLSGANRTTSGNPA